MKHPRRSSGRRHASPGASSDEETASEGEPSSRHPGRGSQAAELARSGRQKLVRKHSAVSRCCLSEKKAYSVAGICRLMTLYWEDLGHRCSKRLFRDA